MLLEPRTEKGSRAKRTFVKAAARLFSKEGFNNSSVEAICQEAELPVGCFYRYFMNKEDVLENIVEVLRTALSQKLEAASGKSPADPVQRAFELFFEFVRENSDFYQVFRESEFVTEEISRRFYQDYVARLIPALRLTGADRDSKELLAYTIIGIQSFFAMKYVIWGKKPVPAAVARDLARLCRFGITGRKARWSDGLIAAALDADERFAARRRKRDVRSRLLASAEFVFGKYGFRKAAVSEVCRLADVSVGNFYNFFSSKEEAFKETTLMLRSQLVERATEVSAGAGSRLEVELRALVGFTGFIREHPFGYRIMSEAEFVDFRLAEQYYGFLLENYAKRMKQTAKTGEFGITDYDTLALAMMGMGHMVGLRYIVWQKRPLRRDFVKKLIKQLFFGVPPRTRVPGT